VFAFGCGVIVVEDIYGDEVSIVVLEGEFE